LEINEEVQLRARGVKITDQLRHDLAEVVRRHGGEVEEIDHPITTLEDLFLRIVHESKAHPGRRYLPTHEKETSRVS
jgi:ABC-2 type transport system ATP-binding protein